MTRYALLFLVLFAASVLYIGLHLSAARFQDLEPVTAHYYDPKTGDTWEAIEYVPKDDERRERR